MEAMIEQDEYAYMAPLNKLRNWLAYSATVPEFRNYLSKGLTEQGEISISPNTMSPLWTEQTLMMVLSIQEDEFDYALANNCQPRFVLLNAEQLWVIELGWLRYGHHVPLRAQKLRRLVELRARLYPPDDCPAPLSKPILAGSMKLPFAGDHYDDDFLGLRDVLGEFTDTTGTITKRNSKGEHHTYTDVPAGESLAFDEQGMFDYEEFMLDRDIARFSNPDVRPGLVLMHLLRIGWISLPRSGHADWDRMIRHANRIHELGLTPILNDPVALVERLGGSRETYAAGDQYDLFSEAV